MTIKQIADKYGLDYQIVYQILNNNDMLNRGAGRSEYNELSVIGVVSVELHERMEACMKKARRYLEMEEKIVDILKRSAQKGT